jgi:hypothetical protein
MKIICSECGGTGITGGADANYPSCPACHGKDIIKAAPKRWSGKKIAGVAFLCLLVVGAICNQDTTSHSAPQAALLGDGARDHAPGGGAGTGTTATGSDETPGDG